MGGMPPLPPTTIALLNGNDEKVRAKMLETPSVQASCRTQFCECAAQFGICHGGIILCRPYPKQSANITESTPTAHFD